MSWCNQFSCLRLARFVAPPLRAQGLHPVLNRPGARFAKNAARFSWMLEDSRQFPLEPEILFDRVGKLRFSGAQSRLAFSEKSGCFSSQSKIHSGRERPPGNGAPAFRAATTHEVETSKTRAISSPVNNLTGLRSSSSWSAGADSVRLPLFFFREVILRSVEVIHRYFAVVRHVCEQLRQTKARAIRPKPPPWPAIDLFPGRYPPRCRPFPGSH